MIYRVSRLSTGLTNILFLLKNLFQQFVFASFLGAKCNGYKQKEPRNVQMSSYDRFTPSLFFI